MSSAATISRKAAKVAKERIREQFSLRAWRLGGISLQEDQRYQNVRIIAVYDTNQIPALRS